MRLLLLLLVTYGISVPTPPSIPTAGAVIKSGTTMSASTLEHGVAAKLDDAIKQLGVAATSVKARRVIAMFSRLPKELREALPSNVVAELVKISQVEPGIWEKIWKFHYWKFLPVPQTGVEWYHADTPLPINVQVKFLAKATDYKALISPTRMLDALWQYRSPANFHGKSGSELYDLLQPYVKLAIKKGMDDIDDLSYLPADKLDALEQVPKTVLESVRFSSGLKKFKDEPKEKLPELLMKEMTKYVKLNMKNRANQVDEFISLVQQQAEVEVPLPYMLDGFASLKDDQMKATIKETFEMMKPFASFLYQHDFTMSYLGYLTDSVSPEKLNEIKKLPRSLIQMFLVHGLTVRGWNPGWSRLDLDKYVEEAGQVVSSIKYMDPAIVPEYLKIAKQSNKKDWDATMMYALYNLPRKMIHSPTAKELYDFIEPGAELISYLDWPMERIEDLALIPRKYFGLLKLVPKKDLNIVPVFRWCELAESASKQHSPEKAVIDLFKRKAKQLASK